MSLTVAAGATVPVTVTATNTGFSTWTSDQGYALVPSYVSFGITAPATVPLASGQSVAPGQVATFTMSLKAPTTSGSYYINTQMSKGGQKFGGTSGYTVLNVAGSSTSSASQGVTLTASPGTVALGAPITVTWNVTGIQPATNDWIGLYSVGAGNMSYRAFKYTGGGVSGSFTFTAPTVSGSYEARYLLKNGFTSAATSNTITVQ